MHLFSLSAATPRCSAAFVMLVDFFGLVLPSNFYRMTHQRQLLRMTKYIKKKPKTKVERADGRSQIKGVCAGGSGYLRRAKLQTMAHTDTVQSSRALLCALLLLLSSITGAQVLVTDSEEELSPRALRDFYPKGPNLTSEKQLVRFAPGTSE